MMKRKKYLLIYILALTIMFFGIIIAQVCFFKVPVLHIFCGIEFPMMNGMGNIDFVRLFQWIWIFFPVWFVVGYYSDMYIQNQSLTVLRYRSFKKWYLSLLGDIAILQAVYMVVLCVVYLLYGYSFSIWPVILISAHVYLMINVSLLLRIILNSVVVSITGVLFVEIFSFIIGDELGINSPYIPGTWGMFFRSLPDVSYKAFKPWKIVSFELVLCFILMYFNYKYIKSGKKPEGTGHE